MVAVVLMGAGASFGSGPAFPCSPPLGKGENGLFDQLVAKGGIAAALPPDLQSIFRNNFEEGMAHYDEMVKGDINAFHRELAVHLLAFQPLVGNELINLIKSLGTKRVIYSTLNYDVMFECAAATLGFPQPRYRLDHGGIGPILLKIHGSANFWPDLGGGSMTNCSFQNVASFVETGINALNREDALRECSIQNSLSPAMCMYAVGKTNRVCKGAVDAMFQQWRETVANASRIFVTGVAVNREDHHIWGTLGRTAAKLIYFGFNSDRPSFDDWKTAFGKTNAYFRQADFKNAIPLMRRELYA